ncbi:MAG TPA: type II toxin-antitoxin system death-on-curing family toxin [Thermoanaerobaculia bacterium]|nr:type II toxin-antitoxin system death-on-curing family toxin [Thermoanaerobaculia bacterium]
MHPQFLSLEDVLHIHENRIRKYGGSTGVRDIGLLQSAMGNAEATFGGEYLNSTLFDMAAAYLYGICRNHPFLDGNKRTALACALAFLGLNGLKLRAGREEVYELVIGVAEGRVTKEDVALFFERHA